MKKTFYSFLLVSLFAIFLSSCQGDGENGNAEYCYFIISFDITYNPCPAGSILGFTIRFIDEDNNTYDYDYVLPTDAGTNHLIGLPSGHTYSAYVLNNGLQNGCSDLIYFDINIINIIDDDTQEVCDVVSTSVDERPEACCHNPEAVFTLEEECDGCPFIEINEPVFPPGAECCFDYSITPKWFPDCFGVCNGGLDHVVELHHSVCKGSPLPEGWTSAITGMTINNSSATIGNCKDCADPTTTLPNGYGANSVNLAVCQPGSHSVLVEITIYDENGISVRVCEEDYYSFSIDECL